MPLWISRTLITGCLVAGLALFAADDAVTGTIVLFAALGVEALSGLLRLLLRNPEAPERPPQSPA